MESGGSSDHFHEAGIETGLLLVLASARGISGSRV